MYSEQVLAVCLGLEWLPITGGALSAVQCARLSKYATRSPTTARLLFTAVWSVATVAGRLLHMFFGSFHPLTVNHFVTIGSGLVLIGWVLVTAAVLQGLKLAKELQSGVDK